ncbi:formimidoylglutamase [Costertonia aggregata]|uniref:Formimidoylglutamase n=1 Tax=Costertonia aggregata TaxID=343403 RepID=A0A7H9AN13_9FLAO|nr:formimidoylglutamase [Costertonia aggregata]QLG44675.1 formimidoylglutamase [Costertonia aggregata]
MAIYQKTNTKIWTGRKSGSQLYLHEKVACIGLDAVKKDNFEKGYAILGYACDEGVKRNQGRVGAKEGPKVIREQLAKLPNHLDKDSKFLDVGTIICTDGAMEDAQNMLSETIYHLLAHDMVPLVFGGGHDMAYGHYNGIKKYVSTKKTIGIVNFDAHFDLRSNANGNNSGTPFYQIAQDCRADTIPFRYLCLGIRKDANDQNLFKTAEQLNVQYLERHHFNLYNLEHVRLRVMQFIEDVDCIYTTIDMDGFSSAYAPGVSAASPMGFSPDIVLECLRLIIDSKKMIGLDIAELNPKYDIDNRTAKLAASLVHYIIHNELH